MKQESILTILALSLTLASVQSAPPKFENTFEKKVVVEGFKAWVLCSATNDSPIKYQWYDKQYSNELTFNESSTVFKIDTAEGSRLIFEKVDQSHEGFYTCSAENQHGLVSKLFQITVNPDSFEGNETLSVEEVHVLNVSDSTVEFLVRASMTVEKYTVKYFEKLNNSSEETQHFSKGEKLVLNGLIPSGLYTFQFQVVSSEGKVSEWSKAQEVILLPYTPEVVLRSLTGKALQIEWSSKLNDFQRGTIDGYSLSYASTRRATYDTWEPIKCFIKIELPRSCSGSQYTIAALENSVYYAIYLRAHTKAGYGKPFITKIYVA